MSNPILFQSSIIHGIILLIVLAMTYQKLPLWLLISICIIIATSCWNHGTTNKLAIWCDRFMTSVITIILLYFLLNTNNIPHSEFIGLGIILAAVLLLVSYQYSRKWRNRLHLAAHIIGTISVSILLLESINI